jgi:hypothetical protein
MALDFIVQCTIRLKLSRICRVEFQHEFQHIGTALGGPGKVITMVKNLEDLQQVSKDNVDTAMKSMGAISKSTQAIAVEVADYSKKAFEDGTAALEKLFGVKSLDKAIELQSEYAKTAYEGFVAQASKMGEMYADLAKETYKPFETMMAKAK